MPGVVEKETEFPRSYIVKDEQGNEYRRNKSFIKKSPNPVTVQIPDLDLEPVKNESNTDIPALSTNDVVESTPGLSTKGYRPRTVRLIVKPSRYRD